jgi:endonuclease/exonuclease/phosphatase (EEP) superfamily protein YafD
VWSKVAIDENAPLGPNSRTVNALLAGPDGPIRLLGVHPPTPVFDFSEWQRELQRIGTLVSSVSEPTLVIGDFNASYWHPAFRDLLRREFTDAHMAHGSGWSTSWPTDKFFPPFVRLDHALTGNGLVSTRVDDFRVPGSDHTGLVVTVKPSD